MFKGVGYRKQAKGFKNAVEYAALKKDMPLVVYINSEEGTRELGKYLNKHIQFTQQCQVAPGILRPDGILPLGYPGGDVLGQTFQHAL